MLTTRELNRALLARQLLLEPAAAPPAEVVARVCGLQTQHAPSGYIGMWSRAAAFRRADLTAALERAEVVQGWVMRSTIHMVAAPDYLPFTTAVRAARRAQWLRAEKRAAGIDMPAVAAAVRRYLGDGPLSQPRLVALLAADGFPRVAWTGAQLWVDLLRAPPAGRGTSRGPTCSRWRSMSWEERSRTTRDRPIRSSTPPASCSSPATCGPSGRPPRPDVASFTGLSITDVRAVLDRCDLRIFRTEAGGVLVDVPDAPLPDAGTPAPVRFLGTWDAVLLVDAGRTQLLPEALRSRVFATSIPRSVPTFLVDGQVAGTWSSWSVGRS